MKPEVSQYAYQSIAEDLLGRIRAGDWAPGDRLPPIRELEREYPQSRMTLYRALRHLVDAGYLSMTQGRGTFVRAAEVRPRVAMLTGPSLFQQSLTPFMLLSFHHAHASLAQAGMDSQLYAEDPVAPSRMPAGLAGELTGEKLAGLLTIDAWFPTAYMQGQAWRDHAMPHVNIGTLPSSHTFYVDRGTFLNQAVALAASRGCRRVALVEKREHLVNDIDKFRARCAEAGLDVVPPPETMPPDVLSFEEYGYELVRTLWAGSPRPDAMIIPDDVIAKGAAQAALALKLEVPRACQLIALTNRGSHLFYPVAMACFEVDVQRIVTSAIDRLIELIQGGEPEPATVLFPPASSPVERGPSMRAH